MNRWARIAASACVISTAAVCWAQPKPENLPVSTWVREDVFAGILVGDMERFEAGVKKLETYLADHRDSGDALAWLAGTQLLRAVRAHEAGDRAAFQRHYDQAMATFARAAADKNQAVFAITGGSFTVMADRLPPELREAAYQRAYDNYVALKAAQAPYFDKLPVHMRGEVLAGLAQAADRIGKPDESKHYLAQLVAALPGTPYESRAKKWMERPEMAKTTSLTCQTCHDAGRLQAVLSAQQ